MFEQIFELYASRAVTTGQNPSARFMYIAGRSEDTAVILELVRNVVPTAFQPHPQLRPLVLTGTAIEPLGAGLWRCTADYGLTQRNSDANPADGGESGNEQGEGDAIGVEVGVDITAATQHITQSLYTVSKTKRTADSRTVPDHKGAIGVSKDGVAGCDIPVPAMAWSETWTWIDAYVTWGYLKTLRGMVGRTNDAKFRSFPIGEVMFMGASTPPSEQGKRKITYHFRSEPSATFKLTPDFPEVTKKGFEYVWVEYEPSTSNNNPIMVPRAVYVERVGRPGLVDDSADPTNEATFDYLGIGK